MTTTASTTRLFAILARETSAAVVFRRGPSNRVRLIKWDRSTDSFAFGQWFKGRIYERRCDLSPDGSKLIYFAANYKKPYYAWTAISTPPFLTALVLWEKGDCWGGGGQFETARDIVLNHWPEQLTPAEGFDLPGKFKVSPFGTRSGWGEDYPVYGNRLIRDGWRPIQDPKEIKHPYGSKVWIEYDPPLIYGRPHPRQGESRVELRLVVKGLKERDGPWYIEEYEVVDPESGHRVSMGRLDWADWDRNGDLLFARSGRLYRLAPTDPKGAPRYDNSAAVEICDLRDSSFSECKAPPHALEW